MYGGYGSRTRGPSRSGVTDTNIELLFRLPQVSVPCGMRSNIFTTPAAQSTFFYTASSQVQPCKQKNKPFSPGMLKIFVSAHKSVSSALVKISKTRRIGRDFSSHTQNQPREAAQYVTRCSQALIEVNYKAVFENATPSRILERD